MKYYKPPEGEDVASPDATAVPDPRLYNIPQGRPHRNISLEVGVMLSEEGEDEDFRVVAPQRSGKIIDPVMMGQDVQETEKHTHVPAPQPMTMQPPVPPPVYTPAPPIQQSPPRPVIQKSYQPQPPSPKPVQRTVSPSPPPRKAEVVREAVPQPVKVPPVQQMQVPPPQPVLQQPVPVVVEEAVKIIPQEEKITPPPVSSVPPSPVLKVSDPEEENNNDNETKHRSLEMEQVQQKVQVKEQETALQTEVSVQKPAVRVADTIDNDRDGYGIDRQLGYDPVETSKTAKQQEEEHDIDVRHKKKKKHGLLRIWERIKEGIAIAIQPIRDVATLMKYTQDKVLEGVRYIAAYRHHSIVRPGDQAGIFDNKIEKQKAAGEKAAKSLEAARDKGGMLESGIQIVEHETFHNPSAEVNRADLGGMEASHTPHVNALMQQRGGGRGI